MVLDADSGFVRVLANRVARVGWHLDVRLAPIAVETLAAMRLDALLLDPRALPGAGEDYVIAVCEALPALAVIVCSERSTTAERVRALRLGVDDWVTKPCHPEEVLARVEAITRRRLRAQAPVPPDAFVAGDLEIRADRFQAFVNGRSVELTRREFEVLSMLVKAEGRVLERADIYERVWGYTMVRGDRSVDVFVRKLRAKIERVSPGWCYVHTHFGVGYRFQAEPRDSSDEPRKSAHFTARSHAGP